jgi:hypothetical protein
MVWIVGCFTRNNPCSEIDFTLIKWQKTSKEITPKNPKYQVFALTQSIFITQ